MTPKPMTEEELAQLREDASNPDHEVARLLVTLEEKTRERDELRAALRMHGRHEGGCAAFMHSEPDDAECTCGLLLALAPTSQQAADAEPIMCVVEVGHGTVRAEWWPAGEPHLTVCDHHRHQFETAYHDDTRVEANQWRPISEHPRRALEPR